MNESLANLEPLLRLGFFAGSLALFALLESLFPRRARQLDRLIRWPANFGIGLLNTLCVRLLLPTSAIGAAALSETAGMGLLQQFPLPAIVTIIVAIILLDLTIYGQHRVMHRFPLLWRLHRMHHTDTDVDVSTALRFHPLEILLSMLVKIVAIVLLGAPVIAVLIFEIILNATAMFNHANLSLPQGLERGLRLFVVTPDMHRVHHSVRPEEMNSNYGFSFSLWDKLFGTYTARPKDGHSHMQTGLPDYPARAAARIDKMLTNPFVR
jgi:sterol desaturase/sphingolipid hydroxylase (fatty acid hydroxylase superfamily)